MKKALIALIYLVVISVTSFIGSSDFAYAQTSTLDVRDEDWRACPITVSANTAPVIISLSNRRATFGGQVRRTGTTTTGCNLFNDNVRITVQRHGLAGNEQDVVIDYSYASGDQTTSWGVDINVSGPLNEGSEVPFQVIYTVTRTGMISGRVHQYTDLGATPDLVKACVTSCGGTNPLPTGQLPSTTPPPSFNYNQDTGYNSNIDYDAAIGNLENPLTAKSIPEVVARIIRIILALIASLAVIVIIIAGFRMVLYGSNPSELSKAKQAILWSVIGLIVSLLSFSIVAIIERLVQRSF